MFLDEAVKIKPEDWGDTPLDKKCFLLDREVVDTSKKYVLSTRLQLPMRNMPALEQLTVYFRKAFPNGEAVSTAKPVETHFPALDF